MTSNRDAYDYLTTESRWYGYQGRAVATIALVEVSPSGETITVHQDRATQRMRLSTASCTARGTLTNLVARALVTAQAHPASRGGKYLIVTFVDRSVEVRKIPAKNQSTVTTQMKVWEDCPPTKSLPLRYALAREVWAFRNGVCVTERLASNATALRWPGGGARNETMGPRGPFRFCTR